MMAGSLLVGASWTPTPRERALLAKVGAARLYSSLVSWILGFVPFELCHVRWKSRSVGTVTSFSGTYLVRARCLAEPGCDAC